MELSGQQLAEFERAGVLILPGLFDAAEVARLRAALTPLFTEESEANIVEKGSGEVRTAMGLHLRSDLFGDGLLL